MISAIFHLARLARAGFVFAREGVFGVIDPEPLPPAARLGLRMARLIERRAEPAAVNRLSAALSRLGPSYIKLGQFLATRPDVVGDALARDLESLQDRLPPFAQADAEAMVAALTGKPVAEAFVSFSPAIAAASIAQVHRAEIEKDGVRHTVAVKVLRPDVRARFAADIGAMVFAAGLAERLAPEARRLKPLEAMADFARVVTMETDLRLEAAALSELSENTRDDPGVHIPTVDWALTGRDVLTTDWIHGIALSNQEALIAAGHDLRALSKTVMQTFLRLALRDGFFHADMHPGNLFVDAQGRLVLVDCGIMGRLGFRERHFLAEILYGFIARNYRRVAEVHFEAGYVPAHHSVENFAQAIRAIGEPIHNRPAREISMARLLTLLFEITALFDMTTRIELVLLQKTMIVVEGVSRTLDPDFDMWTTADPVVREWIERNLGPIGKIEGALSGAGELGRVAASLPALATRAAALVGQLEAVTRDGLVLAPQSIAALGRSEAVHARWRTAALWVAALALVGLWLAVR
ncbi:MAG: 2-polyprenylphenol 6-hydroxylase [Xanthobacteraceae bacterium]|nr:MAG: 2-polyprenylphenol 6-hydroxylase [Xanthobacteraceae bacterium]